jgi:hypothetical protein
LTSGLPYGIRLGGTIGLTRSMLKDKKIKFMDIITNQILKCRMDYSRNLPLEKKEDYQNYN